MVEGIAVEIHQHEHDDRRCDDHRPEPPVARSLHFHVAVHSPCSFQIRGQPPLLTPSSETMPEDCRGSFAKPGPGGTADKERRSYLALADAPRLCTICHTLFRRRRTMVSVPMRLLRRYFYVPTV